MLLPPSESAEFNLRATSRVPPAPAPASASRSSASARERHAAARMLMIEQGSGHSVRRQHGRVAGLAHPVWSRRVERMTTP